MDINMKFCDLTQEETEKVFKKDLLFILPIGATEAHGDHLPVGTDTFINAGVVDRIEEKYGVDQCVVMPAIPYGQVWSLRDAPGSINITESILAGFLRDICMSLHKFGVKRVAIVSSHLGNSAAIKNAARQIFDLCDLKVYSISNIVSKEDFERIFTTPRAHHTYLHACEAETSWLLYIAPDKVKMEKAICQYPEWPADFDFVQTPWTDVIKKPVLGDATAATAEKGKEYIDLSVDNIVKLLKRV